MDKQNVIYLHNFMLVSLGKEGILTPATKWMNLEDMLSEISRHRRTRGDLRTREHNECVWGCWSMAGAL